MGKPIWPCWHLIGWSIFDLSSATADRNLMKLVRKHVLNAIYQVCVFWCRSINLDGCHGLWLVETLSTSSLQPLNGIQRNLTESKTSTSFLPSLFFGADGWTNMAMLASDWLRHFRLLYNCWSEFDETCQEAITKRPLPSLCFWDRSINQDSCPGLWLVETLSTSSRQQLNGIQRDLIESKILTSSPQSLFFSSRFENQDGRPDLWYNSISSLQLFHRIKKILTRPFMSFHNFLT